MIILRGLYLAGCLEMHVGVVMYVPRQGGRSVEECGEWLDTALTISTANFQNPRGPQETQLECARMHPRKKDPAPTSWMVLFARCARKMR